MTTFFWINLSTVLVSALSLIGIFILLLKENILQKILFFLVVLSAGGLMGGAFLHLIPEALEEVSGQRVFLYVLLGFFLFFIIEKTLHWRHCHKNKCPEHTFAYMNLVGDAVHNFIDGLIIAASFVTNFSLGLVATLAIILHEIPQEIGDFGVLIYGGFKKKKALYSNLLVALTAVVGGILGYFISTRIEFFVSFLIPFAAGGFIYIAASDLIPEIRKEESFKKSLIAFLIFGVGILIMYLMRFIE